MRKGWEEKKEKKNVKVTEERNADLSMDLNS